MTDPDDYIGTYQWHLDMIAEVGVSEPISELDHLPRIASQWLMRCKLTQRERDLIDVAIATRRERVDESKAGTSGPSEVFFRESN